MATIYDVAEASGVSLSTVSNVINNGPRPVRPETRRRVLEAIEKLNYHPNAVARGLARQRTHTLGILFGVVESSAIVINSYSASILQAVLSEAAETGYNVTHITRPWRGASESLSAFRDGRTDGLLVVAPTTDSDLIPSLQSIGLPLVVISWPSGSDDFPIVDVDDVHGARLAMDHLIGLGHERIAHVTGHPNLLSAGTRLRAYLDALEANDLEFREEYLRHGIYSPESGYEQTQRLLRLPEPPTAIFAANDEIAFGVMDAARDLGVSVPKRLSVVGVDDRPLSARLTPALTTLRQPFDAVGREAARLLIRRIEGAEVPAGSRLFTPELIVRGSTAPPTS
ncbi:MAG: LacI family DNA-binding transcriptional regulator [Fimbriimonas sp.]